MMAAVRQGLDRQDVHESLRRASHAAAQAMKEGGVPNPLRELIAKDPVLGPLAPRLDEVLDGSRHVGRAPEQVLEFVSGEVDPLLDRHCDLLGAKSEVRV